MVLIGKGLKKEADEKSWTVLDRSCLTGCNQLCHAPFCYTNPVKFPEPVPVILLQTQFLFVIFRDCNETDKRQKIDTTDLYTQILANFQRQKRPCWIFFVLKLPFVSLRRGNTFDAYTQCVIMRKTDDNQIFTGTS